jgi:hypothetical protein
MKAYVFVLTAAVAALIGGTSWLTAQPGSGPPGVARTPEASAVPLEAAGALAAAHLYQTYLNIGLLADARAEGMYDTATAQEVLSAVLSLGSRVDQQLDGIARGSLSREDRDVLAEVRKQSASLREAAQALRQFWKSGRKEDGAKYEALRKKSWAGIEKLLGLKEE